MKNARTENSCLKNAMIAIAVGLVFCLPAQIEHSGTALAQAQWHQATDGAAETPSGSPVEMPKDAPSDLPDQIRKLHSSNPVERAIAACEIGRIARANFPVRGKGVRRPRSQSL